MVRKVVEHVPDSVLQQDLQRYRKRAIELGASDARIISTAEVIIDERVRAKCIYPVCSLYGTNVSCPPYVMELEQVRKLVNCFSYAIFFILAVTSGEETEIDHAIKERAHAIVSTVEGEAFYDGYYLATGFAGTGCKYTFCEEQECSALTPGQGCRYPFKARPAMHAVGMDAFRMAARQGWDIYPVGLSSTLSDIPSVASMGLVLIY